MEYGPLRYRALDRDKTLGLKQHKGDYNSTHAALYSLIEGTGLVDSQHVSQYKRQFIPIPETILQSDASKLGWGAVCMEETIGGRGTPSEATAHINILELKAAFFALKSFAGEESNAHVQLQIDNTTAVSYVNNMGGTQSPELNALALDIWEWAIERSIWLSAVHIPGKENIGADKESRNFSNRHEWVLDKEVFHTIAESYPNLDIDLFATGLNNQLDTYCSWKPDPGSTHVDAFSVDWSKFTFYAFPPFSLVPWCVQKISQDKAQGNTNCPPLANPAMVPLAPSDALRQSTSSATKPHAASTSPLGSSAPSPQKLHLVCPLSGIPSENLTFLQRQQNLSWRHGEQGPRNNTRHISNSGWTFVVKGISITVNRM